MEENLYNRQLGIIHPDKLQIPILIVGAGSIGSWTALALSKLGCSDITVMDGDAIEIHNAGAQIYTAADDGEKKVMALVDKLNFLTNQPVSAIDGMWDRRNPGHVGILDKYQIVIAAVDNITIREQLFNILKTKNVLYIDARMAGNALEIYTVKGNNTEDINAYEKTLFAEEDALEVPCSERSVVYNVFIVAGLICDIIAKSANELELPKELIMDLYNFSLFK